MTFGKLKRTLHRVSGLPVADMTLVFNGDVLEDDLGVSTVDVEVALHLGEGDATASGAGGCVKFLCVARPRVRPCACVRVPTAGAGWWWLGLWMDG
jgi:hypothetical protein